MGSEQKTGSEQTGLLVHSLTEKKKILLWQKFGIAKTLCTKKKKNKSACESWQINIADGAKNMRCDCDLQRLRSVLYPVFFFFFYINKS